MKKKIIFSIAFILMISGVIGTLVTNNIKNKINSNSISVSAESLSNKKIGWGIKRVPNNEQPDLGSKNKQIMDKYQGIAIGNKESKYVYLTFDEGYEAGYTPRILQVLKENDVKATFFLTAHYVNTRGRISKRNDK